MVYFFLAEGADLVKIGFTSKKDPAQRMAEVQTGCPHRLKLLRTAPGGSVAEHRLHRALSAHRVSGEWFRYSAIAKLIATVDPRRFYVFCPVCQRQKTPTQEAWESRTQEPLVIECAKHRKILTAQDRNYDRSIRSV